MSSRPDVAAWPIPHELRGSRSQVLADLLSLAIVSAAYIAAAEIGFTLAFATKQVTAIWPPTGIAVAALLLRGSRAWPGVFLGAFISNAFSHEPFYTAAGIAIGNTLGPLIGVYLLRRFVNIDAGLGRLRDVLGLALVGSALAMTITASNGVANLALGGIVPWAAYPAVWWVWWVGDAMGVLLVAPAILTWYINPRLAWRGARLLELGVLAVALVLVSAAVFSTTIPLAYPIFPVVFWVALRFEQRESATAVLLVSGLAVWQTINDRGPFISGSLDNRLVQLVTFMAVLAVTALALGALAAERRRAEQAMREAKTAAEAANLAKSQFLAHMSHELRTPLNALLGFSEMLELGMVGPLQPRQAEYVSLIHQSGDHLHVVINEILDLAKIDAGKLELYEDEGIEPRHITDSCIAILRDRADLGKLHLSVHTDDPLPLLVADTTRLRQILLNVLSNAIKFTKPGGSVAVTVRHARDGGVAFEVRDTGPGMTVAEIEIALEPFGQVDPELGRHHEGTGLGLPLARRLAELHGGSLHIDSEKGRGTTVTVSLPPSRVMSGANAASVKVRRAASVA